jgi:hypothetical protein
MPVAFSIQLAMRMRLIVICEVPGSTIISTLSLKRKDFLRKAMKSKIWVFIFSTNFLRSIYHYKKK